MRQPDDRTNRDYGRGGRIGIATPQANPTVEPELHHLLPQSATLLTTRLVSQGEPRERFRDYFLQLERSLESFDTLELDAFGFACTASSYLLTEAEQAAVLEPLRKRCAFPLCTAAGAISAALNFIGAKRIAIACPYPQWLEDAAADHWRQQGFELADSYSLQPDTRDTRSIYTLNAAQATEKLRHRWANVSADALVITGTGLPSLAAIANLQQCLGRPVLSSNLCLAWYCLQQAALPLADRKPEAAYPLLGGWEAGLSSL